MSSAKLPYVTSDIPQDLRQFLDRVREAIEGSASKRDVARVVSRLTGSTNLDWGEFDWDAWLEQVDWWEESDRPINIDEILEQLEKHIAESDIAKHLAQRIQIPRVDDRIRELRAEMTATIRELAEGGTEVTIGGKGGYTSLKALKIAADLNSAAIAQVNTISADSSSAAARSIFGLEASVYDPDTGLAKAHAMIAEEALVRASQDSALATTIQTLSAEIDNAETEIASVRRGYVAGDQALSTQLQHLGSRLDQQSAVVRQLDSALVGFCSRAGYTTREQCEAAGGTWHVRPFAEAVRQVAVSSGTRSIAVEQLLRASIGANGNESALIGLKVDHAGYVSGFGLSSQIINGEPVSTFVVRADTFAVGSPDRGGTETALTPFIVRTQPIVLNGVYVPPGVYIRNAFIQDGAITSAKIGTAAIESAKIKEGAITTVHVQQGAIQTAHIQNGAITNAKIQNAAITDAKIQNLSVDKLTTGTLSVGTKIYSANYVSGVSGWMLDGAGDTEFNLAGHRFRITDSVNGSPVTPFRVENGVVYIDQLRVGSTHIESNAVTNVVGASSYGWMPTVSLPLSEPGTQVLVIATANFFNYRSGMTEVHMNLNFGSQTSMHEVGAAFDRGTAVTLTAAGIFSPAISGPATGTASVAIWGTSPAGLDQNVVMGACSISAIAFKR